MIVSYDNSKKDASAFYAFLILLAALCMTYSTLPIFLHATNAGSAITFTDVLMSDGTRASTKYLNYFNFYGVITSNAISVICLIGMSQIILTFLCTMVYYSNQAKWDTVDDMKNNGGGGGGGMLAGNNQGNGGGGLGGGLLASKGLDAVVDSYYKMHINIKRYSACAVDSKSNINAGDMTGMDYIIQQGPGIIFTLLVLNMGWRGTLQMMAGKLIDAFTVGVESLQWDKLVDWAEYKASVETGYTFTLGLSDTEEGKKKEAIAKSMFSKIQGIARLTDEAAIRDLGAKCESFVTNMENKFVFTEQFSALSNSKNRKIGEKLNPSNDTAIIAAIWSNLKYNVVISTTTAPKSVNQAAYAKVSDFATPSAYSKLTSFEGYYIVIALKYEENSDQGIFTSKYEDTDKTKTNVQVDVKQ